VTSCQFDSKLGFRGREAKQGLQRSRGGLRASVEIELQKKENALLVPAEALVTEKNKNSVFVVRDSKAQKVSVNTGFDDGVNVELLKGCSPGDAVITAGKQSVTDGQKVQATESK